MGISGIPTIPMIITSLLQGTLCDTGIPRTFYVGKICSVYIFKLQNYIFAIINNQRNEKSVIAILLFFHNINFNILFNFRQK